VDDFPEEVPLSFGNETSVEVIGSPASQVAMSNTVTAGLPPTCFTGSGQPGLFIKARAAAADGFPSSLATSFA
jgi:hypothetical protein